MRSLLAISIGLLTGAVGPAAAECQCRYAGKVFEQGEQVCIRVDGKARMARCDMALNNSSWVFVGDSCPTAALGLQFTQSAFSPTPPAAVHRDVH
jgi:hypothetical protein